MGKMKEFEKSDDIEIVSIGKLYTGLWDKKYWSSSRGRDRYPYPVGYTSVRTGNGLKYQMEILEGPKGPSFFISSTDGKSSSGETPDIAWEGFQRKGCPRVKLWRGKRFSCKIDGVEFFGFKNTFVQRLLRELIANVGGPSDQSLLLSTFPSETCETTQQLGFAHFANSLISGKRSRNGKMIGRSRSKSVQESNSSIPEEKNELINVEHDMNIVKDVNMFVHDTFDHEGAFADGSSVPTSINHNQLSFNVKEGIVIDVVKSEVFASDSLPEDETGMSASIAHLERCDTDSLGEDISKSMMTVLLPRALPLLKTFSRKKKKGAKPPEISPQCSQERNKEFITNIVDLRMATELTKHSNSEIQEGKACVPQVGNDSLFSALENIESMIPDTLDNDDSEGVLHGGAKGCQLLNTLDKYTELQININAEANSTIYHDEIREHGIHFDGGILSNFSKHPEKDTILDSEKEIVDISRKAGVNSHIMDELPPIMNSKMKSTLLSESIICTSFTNVFPELQSTSCSGIENIKMEVDSRLSIQTQLHMGSKANHLREPFFCYMHAMPISMVQLIVKENDISICVKCVSFKHRESTLFVYKVVSKGENLGHPSFIGHVPIAFHLSNSSLGRDIALESSLLQFTPDAETLVLLNSIKTPYCREGKLHCLCTACSSEFDEQNGVKIVRLNHGFASLVTKLDTSGDVCCLLVCEPNFLLAAEEGGKLKLWIMNCGWSAQRENWYLPTFDCTFPSLVELKRISKSGIIVGHNGFGEFGIWDVAKRNLLSRYSSPGLSILECIPVSIFRWQCKEEHKTEEIVDQIMQATKHCLSEPERHDNCIFSTEDDDMAIWLLISTFDHYSQRYHSGERANLLGSWRLALLINNTVIIGSVIDPGAAAVTSARHGIMGRSNGVVYEWDLFSGTKLGNMHFFEGSQVSCIATDATNSDALAIASGCQLLIYLSS